MTPSTRGDTSPGRGSLPLPASPLSFLISDAWIAPDTPLHLKGQGDARRLAALHERLGYDVEAAAVTPTPHAIRVPLSFWRASESDNVIQHAESSPINLPESDCITVCKQMVAHICSWMLVNALALFYWPPRYLYYMASFMAAGSQELTYCCDAPEPDVDSCDFYLRRLMTSEFYLLYLLFYFISYIFYAVSMMPLKLLAVLSNDYANKLRHSKFSVTCCGIEDQTARGGSNARVRTATVVPAEPMPAPANRASGPPAPAGPTVVPASAVQVLPFSSP
jgi:hypothetical protein